MSGLVPFAVLVCTVNALKGQTAVGDLVIEAPIDTVEAVTKTEGTKPVIAVYVGNEDHKLEGRRMLEGSKRLEIALQIFLPESMRLKLEDGRTIKLDTRGLGAEVVFASLMRQIQRALQAETSPWGERWVRFVQEIHEIVTEPFLFEMPSGKVRGFAREVTIICDTADEPEYGVEPYPFWADFLEGLAALPDYGADVAALIESEIRSPAGLPAWRVAAASEGVPAASAALLGFGPADPTETGEPPVLASVELEAEAVPPGTLSPPPPPDDRTYS